jgi:hypothetical protein
MPKNYLTGRDYINNVLKKIKLNLQEKESIRTRRKCDRPIE